MTIQDLEFQILPLKNKHSDIFYVVCEGYEFIFRPLTHKESINASFFEGSPVELNDYIFNVAVLYCKEGKEAALNTAPAGIVDSVVDCILACSQFGDDKAFEYGLKEARQRSQSVEALIEVYLCTAFRTLTPKDVRNMTFYEQMDYLAIAEAMLGNPVPLESDAPKKGKKKPLSEEARKLLSRQAADKPDFEADNKRLRDL